MKDGQVATTVHEAGASWVADGTPSAAPVTTSTPVVTPDVAAPVETPAASTSATPAATPAIPAGGNIEDRSKAWVDAGKAADTAAAPTTAKEAGDDAAAAAAAAGATPAAQADAAATAQAAFIEAKLDGKPYKIPDNVLFPVIRHGKTEFIPLKQAQAEMMMGRDYQHKTQAIGRERRTLATQSAETRAREARLAEAERLLSIEQQRVQEALNDPTKLAELEEHQRLYRENPIYKQQVDDARENALNKAENAIYRESAQQEVIESAAASAIEALQSYAADYPGVDPEVVRVAYGKALSEGEAQLSEASIRSFYEREANRVATTIAPFKSEMDSMKAELASLRQQLAEKAAADAHNAETDRVLARDHAGRFTKPTPGAPLLGGKPKSEPYAGSLNDSSNSRQKSWINGG